MKKLLIGIIISLISISTVYAGGCITNRYGKVVCGSSGYRAPVSGITYRSNGYRGATTIHQYNGVNRTYGSHGGRAVTRNGYGVARGPGGTTCARGRYHSGCR